MRSGRSASAGSSCSSMICWMSLPRTARFAYAKSSVPCEEHLGDAIGPAAVAAGHGRLGIADALRERIAEGDVAGPGMLLRDHVLHCAKPSGSRMSGPSATLESSEHRDPFRPPAGHLGRRTPLPVVPRAGGLGHREQAARLAGRSPRAVPRRAAARLPRRCDPRRRQDHLRAAPRRRAAGPARHRPHHGRRAHRPPQAPVGGCRGPRRHPARPGVPQRPRPVRPPLPRRGRDLCAGRRCGPPCTASSRSRAAPS